VEGNYEDRDGRIPYLLVAAPRKAMPISADQWKASPFWAIDSHNDLQILADKFAQFYLDKHQFDILRAALLSSL
jgi:hypothetical protein